MKELKNEKMLLKQIHLNFIFSVA